MTRPTKADHSADALLTPPAEAPEAHPDAMTTEQINALLAERGIPVGEIRPAALPAYDGASDEHLLAGGVTAAEAFLLFKAHYEQDPNHAAIGTVVSRISPAQVAGKAVWLPDITGSDTARKHWRNQSAELTRELAFTKEQLEIAKGDIARVYDERCRYLAALRFALFDHLEGTDSPLRAKFRKAYTDVPDVEMTPKEIDTLIIKAAEELGEWARAKEEAEEAKEAEAQIKRAKNVPAKAKKHR